MVRELPDRKFMLDRFTDIRDAIRKSLAPKRRRPKSRGG